LALAAVLKSPHQEREGLALGELGGVACVVGAAIKIVVAPGLAVVQVLLKAHVGLLGHDEHRVETLGTTGIKLENSLSGGHEAVAHEMG
jgi:hypothetical protein